MSYERTLEKSAEGDMTKLSLLLDHDIRFEMLGSSSMLAFRQIAGLCSRTAKTAHLYSLCMKAVCTTLGCCDDVAAAALNPFAAGAT